MNTSRCGWCEALSSVRSVWNGIGLTIKSSGFRVKGVKRDERMAGTTEMGFQKRLKDKRGLDEKEDAVHGVWVTQCAGLAWLG